MRDEVWNDIARAKGFDSVEALLREWYVKQKLSMLHIALDLNCNPGTIKAFLGRFDIPIRPRRIVPDIPKKQLKTLAVQVLVRKYSIGRSTIFKLKKEAKDHS